jgi:peptidyl-prolyl cis-trans isomerase D
MTGNEYAEQFVEAVRRQIGVKRNEQVINRVRNELVGGAASAPAP